MKKPSFVSILLVLFAKSMATAQIVNVGGKFQKDLMIQATIDSPLGFDKRLHHEVYASSRLYLEQETISFRFNASNYLWLFCGR